jgi:serine/threonine protein kinase
VIDRYRLVEAIGDGAMANVYRAQHTTLTDRRYAVKVLRPNMARKPQVAARFRREARILSQIEHPNVVSVIDAGTTPHGLLYMVLEYAEGMTLKGLIKEGPIGVERAASITRQIASALSRVHSMGYIHRDVKPDNIVVTRQEGREVVKILDFGIAGVIDADVNDTRLTEVNLICGTPHYMAPEQAAGEDIGDPVDIYAVGVILYELLIGKTPFTGPMSEVLVQKLVIDPVHPGCHGGLGPLAMQLLSRKAEDRPTAVNLMEQIDRLQAAGWTQAVNESCTLSSSRPSIMRTALAAGVAGFVAIFGFGAMMAYQDLAIADSTPVATAISTPVKAPAPLVVRDREPVAPTVKEKKTSPKRRRITRKKAIKRTPKVVRKSAPTVSEVVELNAAMARLTDESVEPKREIAVERPVLETPAITKEVSKTPIAQDTASSRHNDVPDVRSHSNLPDSTQVSNVGRRVSPSTVNPIKNVRKKAFSGSKRSSAYRMSR